jgi:hypothetical protein
MFLQLLVLVEVVVDLGMVVVGRRERGGGGGGGLMMWHIG